MRVCVFCPNTSMYKRKRIDISATLLPALVEGDETKISYDPKHKFMLYNTYLRKAGSKTEIPQLSIF